MDATRCHSFHHPFQPLAPRVIAWRFVPEGSGGGAWVQVKSSHPEHFLVYSFVIDSAQGEQERKALSEALQAKDAWIRSQALELLSDLDMTTLSDEVHAKRRFKDELKPKILSVFDEDVAFSILITHWSVQ